MHLLDSDHLQTLVAIVDSGSFTRASEVVNKTQSAVSMQIRRLEERIGKPLFEKDGRGVKLTEDGARLVDYARRIVRLNAEAIATFSDRALAGAVRLGVPDDYAERYLPVVLARFAATHPKVEVTIVCEPTQMLTVCMRDNCLDLAIITHSSSHLSPEIIRQERLFWVTSARHDVHKESVLPLALGRTTCCWRSEALGALERVGRAHRILCSSWSSTAMAATVLAGLAVSVLPESAIREGMRILGPSDGFPTLSMAQIGLMRNAVTRGPIVDALAEHIITSLDNLHAPDGVSGAMAVAAE